MFSLFVAIPYSRAMPGGDEEEEEDMFQAAESPPTLSSPPRPVNPTTPGPAITPTRPRPPSPQPFSRSPVFRSQPRRSRSRRRDGVGQEEILNPASILLPPTLDSPQPPMVDLAAVSDGSIEIGVESVPADSNLINNEQEVVVVEPNIEQEVVVVEPNTNEETEIRNALVIGPTEGEEKQCAEVEKKAAVTKPKSKKRKAESLEAETDEGRVCTICFESWSNSGEHRIASLRCGHFFGKSCIEKWLRGSGTACPNCNEKSTKKVCILTGFSWDILRQFKPVRELKSICNTIIVSG